MTRCNEILDHLYEYLHAKDESSEFNEIVQRHLDECRHCFDRFEFERRLLERMKDCECCACPDRLKKKIETLLKDF